MFGSWAPTYWTGTIQNYIFKRKFFSTLFIYSLEYVGVFDKESFNYSFRQFVSGLANTFFNAFIFEVVQVVLDELPYIGFHIPRL